MEPRENRASGLTRSIVIQNLSDGEASEALSREWLQTNGLGGYASGTISGHVSRRYHGLLIAALPAPLGRIVMFNHLSECVAMPDG
ncbi:MAG TPA: glycogen debranching enzyme N-terminal domain-containing protein, partial [Chthoniobacteraceae bacterium]